MSAAPGESRADWVRYWPIIVTLAVGIAGYSKLKADVDSVVDGMGGAGTLPVIRNQIEELKEDNAELAEKVKEVRVEIDQAMNKQEVQADKMMEKIDSLYNLLLRAEIKAEPGGKK